MTGSLRFGSCFVFLLASVVSAAGQNLADKEQVNDGKRVDATIERHASYEVDFKVAIDAPAGTKKLRVWVPLPRNNRVQQISGRTLETFPRPVPHKVHTEPVFGNQFAFFEFDSPDGTQLITHRFEARIGQSSWDVDYTSVAQPETWPDSFAAYRRVDPRAKDDDLQVVLDRINTKNSSPSDRLINAMKWVDENMSYDHSVASLTADPMHAIRHGRGHCSDYHGLCSTLAQKVGYPSCVLYGLQMFDKASPSHCKLEVYLPPYGWVPFDLSETQKLIEKVGSDTTLTPSQRDDAIETIRRRTKNGFRENTWLEVTRGTNYQLAPPASSPVHIVREIYAEADGKSLVNDGDDQGRIKTIYRVDGDSNGRRFQSWQ